MVAAGRAGLSVLLAEITVEAKDGALDELEDALQWYLAMAWKNGQLVGRALHGRVDGGLRAVLYAAAPDALDPRHHSRWATEAWEKLRALARGEPRVRVLADGQPSPDWRAAEGFFLHVTGSDEEGPVFAAKTGAPVPLYTLPLTAQEREALMFWATSYHHHLHVDLGCGSLETAAYKQMAEADSALSREGRALARRLEEVTGLPTFYALHRHWGRWPPEREEQRPCPACGAGWRAQGADETRGLGAFPFRCEPCRLISYDASDFDGRRARIGEWRGKTEAGA